MMPSMDAKLCHKHAATLNGNIIPFIPLHVFEEILLSLDTQTLFHCIFVCRDWNILVSSLDFVSRSSDRSFDSEDQSLLVKVCHCKKNREKSMLTVGTQYMHSRYCQWPATYSLHWDNDQFNLFRTLESPAIDDFKGTEVIDVSNGLVCLAKSELPFKIILLNLTIRKYACLPLPMTWDVTPPHVGFGFDRSSNDFKVVSIVYRYINEFKVATKFDSAWIFSYATWSWKSLTCGIPPSWFIVPDSSHVLFNGVLHWIARHKEDNGYGYEFILTFDLTHEVFGQILLPGGALSYCLNSIVTTGDSLLLVQEVQVMEDEVEDEDEDEDDEDISIFFSIWIMRQYGNYESWTNIFSNTTKINDDYILGARKNGDLILDMGGGEIRRYNPITSTYVLMKAVENSVSICYHTESLYLLEKREDVNSY